MGDEKFISYENERISSSACIIRKIVVASFSDGVRSLNILQDERLSTV